MKKNIYLALFPLAMAMLALASCTQNPSVSPCIDAPLNLTIQQYHIVLNEKRPVCVRLPLPATFTIRINDPRNIVDPGDVSIKEKPDVKEVTIRDTNISAEEVLTVEVKEVKGYNAKAETEYEYLIEVKGVGLLDPKVRIIPGS
jgi:hypothetical protein